jgi:translation initiation factor IF-2
MKNAGRRGPTSPAENARGGTGENQQDFSEQLYARIQQGEVKELKVVIKVMFRVRSKRSRTPGQVSTDAAAWSSIHTGSAASPRATSRSLRPPMPSSLASTSVEPKAAHLAESGGVDIRLYNIIYDAVADIRDAMEGLLEPTLREKHLGRAEIRETFSVPKVGMVAGCYVLDGKMLRNAQVRLLRDNVVIWQGKMSSLRRFKEDMKEVATGYECGIGLENYNDLKVKDIIEAFEMES